MRKTNPWLRGLLALFVILLPTILIALIWRWDSPLYQVQSGLRRFGSIFAVLAVLISFLAGLWFVRGITRERTEFRSAKRSAG